ncbi:hypothetical protein D3C81_1518220 [compost metagenome]
MTLQQVHARGVVRGAAGSAQQLAGMFAVQVGRLVQDQGDRRLGFRLGAFAQGDGLRLHLELRLLDHLAIYRDPAALDIQLGFAARAGQQFGEAFGQTDRVAHRITSCQW